ncbi:hypothetical protein LCGC14_1198520 [marine sediment metagenome]|uniref:Uncharacterized protein n=1 Tax=marine sediment metagenome TaxID=412755 RepID=A0A0F9M500_9ZZZZ
MQRVPEVKEKIKDQGSMGHPEKRFKKIEERVVLLEEAFVILEEKIAELEAKIIVL